MNELSTLNGLQPWPAPPTATIPPDLMAVIRARSATRHKRLQQLPRGRDGSAFPCVPHGRRPLAHSLIEVSASRRNASNWATDSSEVATLAVRHHAEARLRSAASRVRREQQYATRSASSTLVNRRLPRARTPDSSDDTRGNELRAQTDLNKAIAELHCDREFTDGKQRNGLIS